MRFAEQRIEGIKTPILVPEGYKPVGIKDGRIEYRESSGKVHLDEPIFCHGEEKVFLNSYRQSFANDSVIVLLFSPSTNLYLHRRSSRKKWAPGKIDLASIAGQRRALFVGDHFENETLEETALREISEETGIAKERLSKENLIRSGTHHNPHTNEYQTIYTYKIEASLKELNENIKTTSFDEVEKWFEQDYNQTMDEYFGDKIEKYAGGAEMRPVNFISDPAIRKNLDTFHDKLKKVTKKRKSGPAGRGNQIFS